MNVGYTVIEAHIKKLKTKCDKIIYVERESQRPQDFLEFVRMNQGAKIYTYRLEDLGLQLVQIMPALRELSEQGKVIHFIEKGAAKFLSDVSYNNLLLELGQSEKNNMSDQPLVNKGILGRPKIEQAVIETIRDLSYNKKYSIREIANICHVSVGTVHKYVTNSSEN